MREVSAMEAGEGGEEDTHCPLTWGKGKKISASRKRKKLTPDSSSAPNRAKVCFANFFF